MANPESVLMAEIMLAMFEAVEIYAVRNIE
jgi:hypothetical protein